MKTETTITAQTTVNEAIKLFPAAVAVFKRVGIDSCCGGALPIGEAARRHGVAADLLLEEITGQSQRP